ncbi:hypothetical protein ASPZODRAFT_507562 [Penicilliopsis zonata CBS 506.65]|uniref:Uncharacterized protein n=1 Tax=Penicilliopsis zonata CBS 506.65 TaxID=1073090 RepID=A0A1L9SEZ5_9EURO|nr:hypothetical protein ASPZODRAFT_507562 [Penicilliopsis zonata CBS 506.65]OJJ45667.1 hypothetical protein ASPZODRAFT_507562 [Penicilliopsis zonata CBS 506.65]
MHFQKMAKWKLMTKALVGMRAAKNMKLRALKMRCLPAPSSAPVESVEQEAPKVETAPLYRLTAIKRASAVLTFANAPVRGINRSSSIYSRPSFEIASDDDSCSEDEGFDSRDAPVRVSGGRLTPYPSRSPVCSGEGLFFNGSPELIAGPVQNTTVLPERATEGGSSLISSVTAPATANTCLSHSTGLSSKPSIPQIWLDCERPSWSVSSGASFVTSRTVQSNTVTLNMAAHPEGLEAMPLSNPFEDSAEEKAAMGSVKGEMATEEVDMILDSTKPSDSATLVAKDEISESSVHLESTEPRTPVADKHICSDEIENNTTKAREGGKSRIPVPKARVTSCGSPVLRVSPCPQSSIPVPSRRTTSEQSVSSIKHLVGKAPTGKVLPAKKHQISGENGGSIASALEQTTEETSKSDKDAESETYTWGTDDGDDEIVAQRPTGFTGDNRPKFQTSAAKFGSLGPTLKIAPSAERLIMGSDKQEKPLPPTKESQGDEASATFNMDNRQGATKQAQGEQQSSNRVDTREQTHIHDVSGLLSSHQPVSSKSYASLRSKATAQLFQDKNSPIPPPKTSQSNPSLRAFPPRSDSLTPVPDFTARLDAVVASTSQDTTAVANNAVPPSKATTTFEEMEQQILKAQANLARGPKHTDSKVAEPKGNRVFGGLKNMFGKNKPSITKDMIRKVDEFEVTNTSASDEQESTESAKATKSVTETVVTTKPVASKSKGKYQAWNRGLRTPKVADENLPPSVSTPTTSESSLPVPTSVKAPSIPSFARPTNSTQAKANANMRSVSAQEPRLRRPSPIVTAGGSSAAREAKRTPTVKTPLSVKRFAARSGGSSQKASKTPTTASQEPNTGNIQLPPVMGESQMENAQKWIEFLSERIKFEESPDKRGQYLQHLLAVHTVLNNYKQADKEEQDAESLFNLRHLDTVSCLTKLTECLSSVASDLEAH